MRKSLTLIQAQCMDLCDPLTGRRAALEILYSARLYSVPLSSEMTLPTMLFTLNTGEFSSSVTSASLVQIFHLLYFRRSVCHLLSFMSFELKLSRWRHSSLGFSNWALEGRVL